MIKKDSGEELQSRVTIIQLDGQADESLSRELWSYSEQINYDTGIHAVIITGAKKGVFCVGGTGQFKARKADFSLSDPVASINCPVIAAVNGRSSGAAAAIAIACDIRIASENAVFSFPYIRHNIMPCDGITQRLPRLVGQAKAMELLLTGEEIDAEKALEIGLVNRVVRHEALLPAAAELASRLSHQAALAVNYCKEAVLKGLDMTLEQGLRLEGDLYFLLHTTGDRSEGITAFREKRRPRFKGK